MATKKPNTVATVTQLVEPIVREAGVELWDVRFEKEGSLWFLRVYLDKEGGVTIDDCETVSRALSPVLDQADPIEQSYILEVSSPGVERDLVKDWHFQKYVGSPVQVRLIRPVEGIRDFTGIMTGCEEAGITLLLDDDLEMQVLKSEAAYIRLVDQYEGEIPELQD